VLVARTRFHAYCKAKAQLVVVAMAGLDAGARKARSFAASGWPLTVT
jgi:hypothetical protein